MLQLFLIYLCAFCWHYFIQFLFVYNYNNNNNYYYYRYTALGPVRAETRAQSGDWYGSGMLYPGQILRGSLPLLSPIIMITKVLIFLTVCVYLFYSTVRVLQKLHC
jgi:hypothetical protein